MVYTLGREVSNCQYCGASFGAQHNWPRECPNCRETAWNNPIPVAVILVPVTDEAGKDSLVIVNRTIEPAYGQPCLPGGYVEVGETWQEAAVRELREESGIVREAADVTLFDVGNAPATLQIFGILPRQSSSALPPSRPTDETSGWCLLSEPAPLAFPTQSRAVAKYFGAS